MAPSSLALVPVRRLGWKQGRDSQSTCHGMVLELEMLITWPLSQECEWGIKRGVGWGAGHPLAHGQMRD